MRKFGKFLKMFEKVLVLEKNNDTKIKPWFWFPIPKPGFGRQLFQSKFEIDRFN